MTPTDLTQIVTTALHDTYALHESMGDAGTADVQTNQYGDAAMALDIGAEEVILSAFERAGVPIQVMTEEHGTVRYGDTPQYLGVIDGIDGSSVYRRARGTERYGTMLAVFAGTAPRYADYLVCGIMLHAPRPILLLAERGKGCVAIEGDERRPLHCATTTLLANVRSLAYDDYFAINRTTFAERLVGYPLHCSHSSAVHCADVASGAADAMLECTRKHNLEFAVEYGILTEAGGVMVTLDGTSMGDRDYLTFSPIEHVPVIGAATSALAHDIIAKVTM